MLFMISIIINNQYTRANDYVVKRNNSDNNMLYIKIVMCRFKPFTPLDVLAHFWNNLNIHVFWRDVFRVHKGKLVYVSCLFKLQNDNRILCNSYQYDFITFKTKTTLRLLG